MEIINGAPLSEQSQEFQEYFENEMHSKIDFSDSCTQRDEFNRPSVWLLPDMVVRAEYHTQNENYNFNQFLIFNVE